MAVVLVALAGAVQGCGPAGGVRAERIEGAKIAFIFVGTRDDLGYNQAAWEGADAVARAFPDLRVIRRENVPETDAVTRAMEEMIADGARIVFPTSFGYLPFVHDVAERHPDVFFVHQGGVEPRPHLDNLGTYWGTVYEPVYQAGIAAGAASRTNRLGYVVAFPIPATLANVNAFTLGARSVHPKARTILASTGAWCDPARQSEAARMLLAERADVLTQHQDCTRTVLEIAEAAGVRSVGYHSDGSEVAPRGWLVGSVWNWKPLFVDIVRTIHEGRFAASPYNGDYRGGYRTGDNPFVLTEFGSGMSPATRARIDTAALRFRRGGSPFDGPLRDWEGRLRVPAGKTPSISVIDRMDYFVEGVVGDIPD